MPEQYIENISDDILLGGRTEKELKEKTKTAFKIADENKLTLNLNKCEFNKKEIICYGFKISEDGMRPVQSKIDVIQNFKQPTNP